jgi:hypothetical protein
MFEFVGRIAQLVEQRTENSKGAISPFFIIGTPKSSSVIKCLISLNRIHFQNFKFAIAKNHKSSRFQPWGYKEGIQSRKKEFSKSKKGLLDLRSFSARDTKRDAKFYIHFYSGGI